MLYRIIQIENKLKGHDDAFDWILLKKKAICIHAYTFSIFRNFWKQFQIQNFISVNQHTYVYRYVAVHSLVGQRSVFQQRFLSALSKNNRVAREIRTARRADQQNLENDSTVFISIYAASWLKNIRIIQRAHPGQESL